MSQEIKGIIVEIGGNTAPLDKALKGVNQRSRETESELKKIEKLLKLDPTNTILLAQKQALLSQAVEISTQKLTALRQAQDKVEKAHAANDEWERQYKPIGEAIDAVQQKLKDLRAQESKMSEALKSGKIDQTKYDALQKETHDTTLELDQLIQAAKDLESQFENGHLDDTQYRHYHQQLIAITQECEKNKSAYEKTIDPALDLEAVVKRSSESTRAFRQEMQLVNAQNDKNAAALGDEATATQKLSVEKETLTKKITLQSQETQRLESELDAISKVEGENSEATRQKRIQVEQSNTALLTYQNGLKNVNKELSIYSAESKKETLTKQIALQSQEMKRLKEELESVSKAEGKNSEAAKQKRIQVEQSNATLLAYQNELKSVNRELLSNSAASERANNKFVQEMQLINAQHDRAVTKLSKNATATQKLTIEKKTLTKEIALQKAETKRLEEELEILTKAEGDNAEAIRKKRTEMEESISAHGKYKKELEDVEKGLSGNSAALKEFGQKTTDLGKKIMPASLAVAGLGAAAFTMASDYEESLNKMQVVFGKNATEVESWSKTTLEQFGISSGSALEMVSLFGDMATGMEIPQREAAEMSMSLVGLAGELSSFKNISKDVAENALKGIFTGEGESLKELGVIMNDTTLTEYALSQGTKTLYNDMSQVEKVQLRYNFVMDATKNSQGDFANTSDQAANSTRVMNESLKELGIVFGQELLPIITPIIQSITRVIQSFSSMDEGTRQTIVTIGMMIAVAGPLLMAIGSIATGISAIGGALAFLGNPIVLLIAAIAALVVGFIYLWNTSEEFRDFFIGMGEDIAGAFTAVGDFFVNLFTRTIPGALQKMSDFFGKIFDTLADIAKKPINAIIGLLNGAIEGINFLISGINSLTIDMPDWMPEWLGGGQTISLFNIPEIPSIPLLAKGGILSEGQAIVAEAGPEMIQMIGGKAVVTPLSGSAKNTAAYNQSSTVQNVFHINVTGIDELNKLVYWFTHQKQMARAMGGGVI